MLRTPTSIVALFGLIIFSPLLEGGTTHVAVMGIRLLILFLACLFLLQSFHSKMVAWPSLSLDWVVAAYLGVAAVSVLLSSYKDASLQWFLVLLSYAGLLYLFVHFVVRWEHITAIVVVLVLMGLFESSVAIHQILWHRSNRPTGTFFNPNFLAGYLASIGSIVLGLLCYSRIRLRFARRLRLLIHSNIAKSFMLGSVFFIILLAVLFTGSRAGLVAFLAGMTTVIGMRFGRKAVAILLTCCVMVLVLMPNPLRGRIYAEHVSNPEAYARWNIWHSSIYAILDHPFGAGLGLYQYIYPRYAIPHEGTLSRYGRIAQTAHNEYLQIGVELGLAGLIVFLCGMVVLFREIRKVMSGRLARWQRGVVVGATGAVTSIMIHALFDSNLHEPGIAIMLILCVAIVLATQRLTNRCHDSDRRVSLESKTVRLAWASGGTVLALILLVAILRPALAWTAYEDGSYAAKQQDHHTAIARYQAAIELEPGKALYHSSLAASYFTMFERTGDPALSDATLMELQVARHLNPLDGRLWGLEGYVYRSLSDHQHVVHAREPASAKQLMDWRALARFAYENAVVLEPFNPMHYLELGRLHLKEGHPERAMATLRQATAVEPNFLPAREWLVRMYLELGETDRAQAEYREILDRRDRFKHAMKNAFEAQFLSVDVNSLEAAIASSKGRT